MNCIYRLILGKPLFPKKKPVETASISANPILTIQLLKAPLPDTLEELSKLEEMVGKRMSAINSLSQNLTMDIQKQMSQGQHVRANHTLTRKSSLRNDINQLSKKLVEIQEKREQLMSASGFH